MDVVTISAILAEEYPPEKHGQLCPIWTRRQYGDGECDCFVKATVDRMAARVLLRLASATYARLTADAEGSQDD